MLKIAAVFGLNLIPDPVARRDAVADAVFRHPHDLVLAENYDCEGDGYWVTVYGPALDLLQLQSRIGVERGASAKLGKDLNVPCLSVTGTLAQVKPLVEQALTAVPA